MASNQASTSPITDTRPSMDPGSEQLYGPTSRPPLYFGLTRPIGTPVAIIVRELEHILGDAGYAPKQIKLSEKIDRALPVNPDRSGIAQDEDEFSRYIRLMKKGDLLRTALGTTAIADIGIVSIHKRRANDLLSERVQQKSPAYIISSIVHPDEVQRFREVYGTRFFLIGINSPVAMRQALLTKHLSESRSTTASPEKLAQSLIQIDSGLRPAVESVPRTDRLNIDRTFHEADLFVSLDRESTDDPEGSIVKSTRDEQALATVRRFMGQIFGYPFGTLSSDEYSMGQAYLAAKRSASLGRSVGAAIVDPYNSIIATGCNDVASSGGGLYKQGDDPDNRDHKVGYDASDRYRIDAIRDFLNVLLGAHDWLPAMGEELDATTRQWLANFATLSASVGIPPDSLAHSIPSLEPFRTTRIVNLIEFGRSVHAEMAAITEAAMRGVSVRRASVFVTTFPCHECARNIIASGIQKLIYVEPYGKSMAEKLYWHDLKVFGAKAEGQRDDPVLFEPYVGIAPKRFDQLFHPVSRKSGVTDGASTLHEGGRATSWSWKRSMLRPSVLGYKIPDTLVYGADVRCVPVIEMSLLVREQYYAERTEESLQRISQSLGTG